MKTIYLFLLFTFLSLRSDAQNYYSDSLPINEARASKEISAAKFYKGISQLQYLLIDTLLNGKAFFMNGSPVQSDYAIAFVDSNRVIIFPVLLDTNSKYNISFNDSTDFNNDSCNDIMITWSYSFHAGNEYDLVEGYGVIGLVEIWDVVHQKNMLSLTKKAYVTSINNEYGHTNRYTSPDFRFDFTNGVLQITDSNYGTDNAWFRDSRTREYIFSSGKFRRKR